MARSLAVACSICHHEAIISVAPGPLDDRRGLDAGQKRADHAAIAVDVATARRRRKRAGYRAYAGGGAQHDPGQSWAGAGGRDRAIVRHRAPLESAARDVAPCTGPEVGTDCIAGLRLIRPRIEPRKPAAMVQRRFPIDGKLSAGTTSLCAAGEDPYRHV